MTVSNYLFPPTPKSSDEEAKDGFVRKMPTHTTVWVYGESPNPVITPPSGAWKVVFSATADFWLKNGGTVSIPSASSTVGTSPTLNPSALSMEGVTSFGLDAESACVVTMDWYL